MCYGKMGSLLVVAFCFLAACAQRGSGDGTPSQVDRPIYYGTPDSNPAVVAITNGPGMGFFCSGTLITPNVVLTAAHCLEGTNTSTIQIMFGDSVGSGGATCRRWLLSATQMQESHRFLTVLRGHKSWQKICFSPHWTRPCDN